ncbi:MAG: glycosyltransferase [Fibrobacterota bacterium]|nr:glycosyltransferase [Fibrobacterota bacterium]QQS06096.1 MAG: glycosyltransferase [Fibrobacterota bacterium]
MESDLTNAFSVLIVGYNCTEDIRIMLESMRRFASWSRCEILIAENGDCEIPQMEALARDFGARIEFLPNPGYGVACNVLARKAVNPLILLANPDLCFVEDVLPDFARHLDHPEVGAIGPRMMDADGSEQTSWNEPMGLWWETLEAFGLQMRWRRHLIRKMRSRCPEGPWEVGIATAGCLAMRSELYRSIAGFDEGFFLNGEDLDLCDRIRAAGKKILVDPKLNVVHGNSRIQSRNLSRFIADRLEGKRKYLSRRHHGLSLLVARALWVTMVTIRLTVGFFVLRGTERTRLQGYWGILSKSIRLLFKN